MKLEELELRNRLLNLAIASAETKGFIEVERAKSEEILLLRPTIHITIEMPYGQGKSTLAKRIENYIISHRENHPHTKVSSATWASIVGSIDEKGKITPPLNYNYKGGTVIIDEFQTARDESRSSVDATLTILEDEWTSRNIARQPKKKINIEDCYIGDGKIEFKNLRSNWIFLTARNLQLNRQLSMRMLIDRTVPVLMWLDREDLKAIDDDPKLMFEGMYFEPLSNVKIESKEYIEIRNYVDAYMDKTETKIDSWRAYNDCVRVYAIEREFDSEIFDYILKNKTRFAKEIEKEAQNEISAV